MASVTGAMIEILLPPMFPMQVLLLHVAVFRKRVAGSGMTVLAGAVDDKSSSFRQLKRALSWVVIRRTNTVSGRKPYR